MGKARRKRMRKSALIRNAPRPNREMLARYHHSAKSLEIEETYVDALVDKMNRGKGPQHSTEFIKFSHFHPLSKVKERLRELREFLPLERFVSLKQAPEYHYKMYFNESDKHAFLVKEDYVLGLVSRSLRFKDRQSVVNAFWLMMAGKKEIPFVSCISLVQPVPPKSD